MERPERPAADPSMEQAGRRLVYLAAERTLLTWVRAAVTLMALGFVVDRFGLLIRGTRAAQGVGGGVAWSLGLGVLILGIGVVVNVFAAVRYLRFVHRFERGDSDPGHGIRAAIALSLGLAALGVVLALYLGLSA
jgi:putative membrane protein